MALFSNAEAFRLNAAVAFKNLEFAAICFGLEQIAKNFTFFLWHQNIKFTGWQQTSGRLGESVRKGPTSMSGRNRWRQVLPRRRNAASSP